MGSCNERDRSEDFRVGRSTTPAFSRVHQGRNLKRKKKSFFSFAVVQFEYAAQHLLIPPPNEWRWKEETSPYGWWLFSSALCWRVGKPTGHSRRRGLKRRSFYPSILFDAHYKWWMISLSLSLFLLLLFFLLYLAVRFFSSSTTLKPSAPSHPSSSSRKGQIRKKSWFDCCLLVCRSGGREA